MPAPGGRDPRRGATTTLAIVYTFRPEGGTLVVESTMRDATEPRQVGTVYRRSTDALPPPLKGPNVTVAPATIAALGWLVGDGVGTVGATEVEERWMSPAGGAMIGNSRTTRGTPSAMVEFEYPCIAQRAGSRLHRDAQRRRRDGFPAHEGTGRQRDARESRHDFPKAITYTRRADGGYDATISGAPRQRALTWAFRKK